MCCGYIWPEQSRIEIATTHAVSLIVQQARIHTRTIFKASKDATKKQKFQNAEGASNPGIRSSREGPRCKLICNLQRMNDWTTQTSTSLVDIAPGDRLGITCIARNFPDPGKCLESRAYLRYFEVAYRQSPSS